MKNFILGKRRFRFELFNNYVDKLRVRDRKIITLSITAFFLIFAIALLVSCSEGSTGSSSGSIPSNVKSAVRAEVVSEGYTLVKINSVSKVGGESFTGEQAWRANTIVKTSIGQKINLPIIVVVR